MFETQAIEEPAYEVVQQDEKFEVRRYEPMIIAEVLVDGTLGRASNKGFRLVADYIFGNNQAQDGEQQKVAMTAPVTIEPQAQKIAMTAPVTIEQQSSPNVTTSDEQNEPQQWRVHFVMPSEYALESLPKPNNPRVSLRQVPARLMAVHTFSGFSGAKKVEQKTQELNAWLTSQNMQSIGAASLSRYDPPWVLPFRRRNEIQVQVKQNE